MMSEIFGGHEVCENQEDECPCESMDAEDMLFLLYTSGSTGKPKGIIHTTGGYMVYTYLTSNGFLIYGPDTDQVYWCTADIGWNYRAQLYYLWCPSKPCSYFDVRRRT